MKKSIKLLGLALLAIFFCSPTVLLAQTREEHRQKVSENYVKVLEHSKVIIDNPTMTKNDIREHDKQVGEHLKMAKEHFVEMEKMMTVEETKSVASEAVEKDNASATIHQHALAKQVNKINLNKVKIKKHATKLHHAITKAEVELTKLKMN